MKDFSKFIHWLETFSYFTNMDLMIETSSNMALQNNKELLENKGWEMEGSSRLTLRPWNFLSYSACRIKQENPLEHKRNKKGKRGKKGKKGSLHPISRKGLKCLDTLFPKTQEKQTIEIQEIIQDTKEGWKPNFFTIAFKKVSFNIVKSFTYIQFKAKWCFLHFLLILKWWKSS